MEEKDKEVMRKMHVKLVRELDTTGLLLDYLYQEHILTEDDVENIKAKKISKKKAEKLLKILKKRRMGLKMLIAALIITKVQDFLGFEILENTTWTEEEKKSFDLKLEGKSDELQRLELELAALKLEKLQSEAKRLEWEERFKEKEQELQDIQNNITRTSREVSNSSFFRKFFKRSQRSSKQDKATNTEEADYFTPRYENYAEVSPNFELDVFAHLPELPNDRKSTNSARVPSKMEYRRTDSCPGSRTDSYTGSRIGSRPASRSGSVVSSASLKIRNAFAGLRRNQETDGYSSLSTSFGQ